MTTTSTTTPSNITIRDGYIYGKFIEIELGGLTQDFSFSPTKVDGVSNLFDVSKSPQAGGSDAKIGVSEVWVNGESILLVLDETDSNFPNWSDATLRD